MTDFTDLVARAVNPAMNRAEREQVYDVVRQAVQRLAEREARSPHEPAAVLQRHLIEETIRDVEGDIVRYLALERIRQVSEAQDAEHAARVAKR